MADHKLLYLSRTDVETVALDMRTILKLLEHAFKELESLRESAEPILTFTFDLGLTHLTERSIYNKRQI